MEIASKIKRQFIVAVALGIMPNLILAAIVTLIIGDAHTSFWISFLAILGCIYAMSLIFWLRDTIWEWSWYFYRGKKELVSNFIIYLKHHKFPEPDDYIESGSDWILRIAEDKNGNPDLRTVASGECGALSAMRVNGLFQRALRVGICLDNAVQLYKEDFINKSLRNNDASDLIKGFDEQEEFSDMNPSNIDEELDEGDIKTFQLVEFKCKMAESRFKSINGENTERDDYEREQFDGLIKICLGHSEEIKSNFYKSAALHSIAKTLLNVGNFDYAESISKSIAEDFIQEKALDELKQAKLK